MHKLAENYKQTDTHTRGTTTVTIIIRLFEALKLIRIIIIKLHVCKTAENLKV